MASIEVLPFGDILTEALHTPKLSTQGITVSGAVTDLNLVSGTGKAVVFAVGDAGVLSVSSGSVVASSSVAGVTTAGAISAAAATVSGSATVAALALTGTLSAAAVSVATLTVSGVATVAQLRSGTVSVASGSLLHAGSGSLFFDIAVAGALSAMRGGVPSSEDTLAKMKTFIDSNVIAATGTTVLVTNQSVARAVAATLPSASITNGTYYYPANGVALSTGDKLLSGTLMQTFSQESATAAGAFSVDAAQSDLIAVRGVGLFNRGTLSVPCNTVQSGVCWLTSDGATYLQTATPAVSMASWTVSSTPSAAIVAQLTAFLRSCLDGGVAGDTVLAVVRSGGGSSNGAQLFGARLVGSLYIRVTTAENSNTVQSYATTVVVGDYTYF